MEYIVQAMELKAELDKLRPIDQEREAIIMQKFRLDWDYHSNHLEGNSLTYGETKALIMFGITAQGKPLKDHFEITGHDEAIKWVTEIVKGEFLLTEKFIRELHLLLLKSPYEVDAITSDGQPTKKRIEVGKYKSVPNHVKTRTGEIFRFAAPEETPAPMHDLIEWYRAKKGTSDTNPVILAAEFHYRFIRIHPFDDGNGRIARILMNFILMQFRYPPVIIKVEDKGNYFSALQQADSGIIEPFFEYIAKNLVRSLEIMIAGAKGERIEEPDDLDKEIALLEQRFKNLGRKVEKIKSKEAVLEIYEGSFVKIALAFDKANEKFKRFYITNNSNLQIGATAYESDSFSDLVSPAMQQISEGISEIRLSCTHKFFKQATTQIIEYIEMIIFNFHNISYNVLATGTAPIDKLYTEQLTNKEIDDLIKGITQSHKKFIEERLNEIEHKNQ